MLEVDPTPRKVQAKQLRLYNKVLSDFKDRYYLGKIRPSKKKINAEDIYDENMKLKHEIKQL